MQESPFLREIFVFPGYRQPFSTEGGRILGSERAYACSDPKMRGFSVRLRWIAKSSEKTADLAIPGSQNINPRQPESHE
jgi:hypothetical protein